MAKIQKAAAVALLDLAAYGVKAGSIVEGDVAVIEQLKKDGAVDPHKNALAYARGAQVPVVNLSAKAEAEKAEADAAAIAELEAKLAAAPDADKPALKAQIDAIKAG